MRLTLLSLCTWTLLLATSRADDPTKKNIYRSPQAVFQAMKTAMKKLDLATYFNLMTEASQKEVAYEMLSEATSVILRKNDPDIPVQNDRRNRLQAVLNAHGLTKEKLTRLSLALRKKSRKQHADEYFKVLQGLKKRGELIQELMIAREGEAMRREMQGFEIKLDEIKTTGNRGLGKMSITHRGKTRTQTVLFLKEKGGWKFAMAELQQERRKQDENDLKKVDPKPVRKKPIDK